MTGMFVSKVALVTGAGSGIGRATALAFAREGASVVVADIAAESGTQTVARIRDTGGDATFVQVDVSQAVEVEALVRTTVQTYGRLDYAHNNAGIEGVLAPLLDYPDEVFDRVLAVNLKGVWLCLKREISQMLAQGGGAIVNTASVAGLRGSPTLPAYNVSKFGVVGLTKSVALAYASRGVRINAVCPGVIDTPMVGRADELTQGGFSERGRARTPLSRLGSPEEVAAAVTWLCSDAASFLTGVALPVDGGLTA